MTHLLKTAGAAAGSTPEGFDQTNDFLLIVIFDLKVKVSQRATAVPGAAVTVLLRTVDLLAQAVLDLIPVFGLKADQSWRSQKCVDS